jgi:hypothetical protein
MTNYTEVIKMSFKIAIDDTLDNIKNILIEQGYQTVDFTMADFRDVDAYVIDSHNKDLMRIKTSIGDEPVIAATNQDADRVVKTLRNRLKHYEKEINEP